MQWLQIVLMILKLLKEAKSHQSAEGFAVSAQAENSLLSGNGEVLRWLWENRQAIIDFITSFFGTTRSPGTFKAPSVPGGAAGVESSELTEVRSLLAELNS